MPALKAGDRKAMDHVLGMWALIIPAAGTGLVPILWSASSTWMAADVCFSPKYNRDASSSPCWTP